VRRGRGRLLLRAGGPKLPDPGLRHRSKEAPSARSGARRDGMLTSWDTIVIGSGSGGLAAAVALARAGQRVLVLEQHYLPGGWCQSFSLEGYRFSPGVHYLGCLGPGGALRRLYEGLGLSDDLEFCEMNPDG